MAAIKITSLSAISTIDTAVDPLPIVDVSDTSQAASGTTKKVTVDQIESAIFGATGSKAIVVDNVAALKALAVASVDDGQVFLTRGYYTENDGGQGSYIYDSTSAAADNGGTFIAPTSGSGRYLLQYSRNLNVKQFGAKGDGSTNDAASIQAAVDSIGASGGCVFFPPGTYIGYVFVWKNNVSILGSGSSCTKLKLPNSCPQVTKPWEPGGTISYVPNVIEVGQSAMGNAADVFSGFVIQGITIDGNKANNSSPSNDLGWHGIILTKTSNHSSSDLVSTNCHNAGVAIVINSNHGTVSAKVSGCGNSSQTGPGFDINSSKYLVVDCVSDSCYQGARLLDNCWGNNLRVSSYNSTSHGFIYNNQTVNSSYDNVIDVTVIGSGANGFVLGSNCKSSDIAATIVNAVGSGFVTGSIASQYRPSNNIIDVTTRSSGASGVNVFGTANTIIHQSYLDGRTGSAGSYFACDITGDNNTIEATIIDSSPWQVRGLAIRSGSANNVVKALSWTNVIPAIQDDGSQTSIARAGFETSASASVVDVPRLANTLQITGSATINSITCSSSDVGRVLTCLFSSTATVVDGSNMKLNGNFVATSNSVLSLVSDGTNWYETARSFN